jgi:hypothetical protein
LLGRLQMSRLSLRQIILLLFGFGLMLGAIFYDSLLARWENYLYPNAVIWQGVRVVPGKTHFFDTVRPEMLVVKDLTRPQATLTLYLHKEDGQTPESMIRELCSRDSCEKIELKPRTVDRAAANYRSEGETMQVRLIRLNNSRVWVEYKGQPEAYAAFDKLVESVASAVAKSGK